jgi:hypothetical protein
METALLKQLVRDAQYPVDETAIAQAIMARLTARNLVAGVTFHSEGLKWSVRSFWPTRQARSFHLCDPRRRSVRR